MDEIHIDEIHVDAYMWMKYMDCYGMGGGELLNGANRHRR